MERLKQNMINVYYNNLESHAKKHKIDINLPKIDKQDYDDNIFTPTLTEEPSTESNVDDFMYKKPWNKLNIIHKIIKMKEFVNELNIEDSEMKKHLKNQLVTMLIQYQDYINEEYIIINKLKNKLIDYGIEENELNYVLFNFYNYFDIPITMRLIENVPLHSPYSLYHNHHDNNNPDDIDLDLETESSGLEPSGLETEPSGLETGPSGLETDDSDIFEGIDNEPQYFTTIIYTHDINTEGNLGHIGPIGNLFNLLFNNQQEEYEYEDIVVTTDINSLNNLPICKITNDMQIICSICQEEMNENEEYINIECKHIFHRNCLSTYLTNYNHICPTCRKEIGNPNINYNNHYNNH